MTSAGITTWGQSVDWSHDPRDADPKPADCSEVHRAREKAAVWQSWPVVGPRRSIGTRWQMLRMQQHTGKPESHERPSEDLLSHRALRGRAPGERKNGHTGTPGSSHQSGSHRQGSDAGDACVLCFSDMGCTVLWRKGRGLQRGADVASWTCRRWLCRVQPHASCLQHCDPVKTAVSLRISALWGTR